MVASSSVKSRKNGYGTGVLSVTVCGLGSLPPGDDPAFRDIAMIQNMSAGNR